MKLAFIHVTYQGISLTWSNICTVSRSRGDANVQCLLPLRVPCGNIFSFYLQLIFDVFNDPHFALKNLVEYVLFLVFFFFWSHDNSCVGFGDSKFDSII